MPAMHVRQEYNKGLIYDDTAPSVIVLAGSEAQPLQPTLYALLSGRAIHLGDLALHGQPLADSYRYALTGPSDVAVRADHTATFVGNERNDALAHPVVFLYKGIDTHRHFAPAVGIADENHIVILDSNVALHSQPYSGTSLSLITDILSFLSHLCIRFA